MWHHGFITRDVPQKMTGGGGEGRQGVQGKRTSKETDDDPKSSSSPTSSRQNRAAASRPQGPTAPPAPRAPTTAPSALTATDSTAQKVAPPTTYAVPRSDTDWKTHYEEMLAHYQASKKWWTSQMTSTQARLATTQMQLDLQTKHSQTLQNQFLGAQFLGD